MLVPQGICACSRLSLHHVCFHLYKHSFIRVEGPSIKIQFPSWVEAERTSIRVSMNKLYIEATDLMCTHGAQCVPMALKVYTKFYHSPSIAAPVTVVTPVNVQVPAPDFYLQSPKHAAAGILVQTWDNKSCPPNT